MFAREGFQATNIQDIAVEASVVPTAIYYHFSSKDELYEAALEHVFGQLDAVVEDVRSGSRDVPSFSDVIGAVWDWVEDNPEPAKLLYHQLPGATANSLRLRRNFEDRHIDRMVDYLPKRDAPASRSEAALRWTMTSLIMRSLFHMGMNTHSLRLGDGPLARQSSKALRRAYLATSLRMLAAADG